MTPEFGVYVAPGPGDPAAFAVAAGLSVADAKMILASRLPRRATLEADREGATSRARALKAAGFDAFVVTRRALGEAPPPRAKSFRMEGGTLLLDVLSFAPGELKLVVEGEILRVTEEQISVRTDDEGPARYERESVTRRSDGEVFLHLYGEGRRKAVEIRPRSFNFRALGAQFGTSTAVNTARFLARLRELFPGMVHDDRLRRYPPFPDEGVFAYDGDLECQRKVRKDDNEKAALATSRLLAIHRLRA